MLAELDPHLIWFPAVRHESYCYILNSVIHTPYPIVAAATGSFPERLAGRPYTDVPLRASGFDFYKNFVFASLAMTMDTAEPLNWCTHTTSTPSNMCSKLQSRFWRGIKKCSRGWIARKNGWSSLLSIRDMCWSVAV
mmetsp:Transcript_22426/g.32253  ORF Transcript_22426/g.32253 Transcript_22426/m.32253 type:complete len:137 (+) Transcript_22426:1949-2359(+)